MTRPIRTAESIDDHLANATPRPPTPAEYAEGVRDTAIFFAICAFAFVGFSYLWS